MSEAEQQSEQWEEASGSAVKKVKIIPSARKVMTTVFWDLQGGVLIRLF